MSRVLYKAVLQALKEAHAAYLAHCRKQFCDNIKVAECAIAAIESLGVDCGREMELMGLKAEMELVQALPMMHRPAEIIAHYEAAKLQMLLPPSMVVSRDAPMLPHCEDAIDFFGGADDQTADDLSRAAALYAQLTDGGGGGVAEIYRAQMARQRGAPEEAHHWANRALERMGGDRWIEPIARRLIQADASSE